MKSPFFLVLSMVALAACAEQQNSFSKLLSNSQNDLVSEKMSLTSSNQLTVVNSANQPIPNASVLIGIAPGNPFTGNTLTTDASGQVQLPVNYTVAEPVTVQATGYVTLTYSNLAPSSQTLQMDATAGAAEIEIAGNTTNFTGVVNGDGNIHFGLVIPALTRESMLSFDLSTVLSPQNDTISIANNNENIPSNLTLPNQSQTYIVVPVNLNKPAYRSYVRDPGAYQMNAIHGSFPMNTVVGDIQNGDSVFDVIDYFTFVSVGQVNVTASGDTTGQDINVGQIPLDTNLPMRAPQFASTDVMLTLALAENSGGQFSVTDLKKFTPGQAILLKGSSQLTSRYMLSALVPNTTGSQPVHALSAEDLMPVDKAFGALFSLMTNTISAPSFNQFSLTLQTAGSAAPNFLPLINAPTVTATQITVTPPTLPSGLQALGTYLTYADIQNVNSSELRTPLWEMWTAGFASTFALPQIAFTPVSGHTYRWEVLFMAADAGVTPSVGRGAIDLNNVSYITHNLVNVQ